MLERRLPFDDASPEDIRTSDHGQSVPARCPNCKRDAALQLRDVFRIWPDPPEVGGSADETLVAAVQIWLCLHCDRTTTILYTQSKTALRTDEQGSSYLDWKTESMFVVWPNQPPRDLPPEVPEDIRSLFREASVAENAGAPRGAAALYRATVEEICDNEQIPKEDGSRPLSLRSRIDRLAQKGLEEDIIQDLHEARATGNYSLHEAIPFSREELADVAGLIAHAVETLYVNPVRKARMKAAREARTRPQPPSA